MPSSSAVGRSQSRPPVSSHRRAVATNFVFGSSTPRELSHISALSKHERFIETKLKPKPCAELRDTSFYIRQARANDSRAGSEQRGPPRNYAFGSSTPRSLSHLSNMARGQQVYDAKLEKRHEALRSATNPQIADNRQRGKRGFSMESRREEDAASEPDIVQDRRIEFGQLERGRKKEDPRRGEEERRLETAQNHAAVGEESKEKLVPEAIEGKTERVDISQVDKEREVTVAVREGNNDKYK